MNTPIWVPLIVVAILAIISIILITGKGSVSIAGYNLHSIVLRCLRLFLGLSRGDCLEQ